MISAHGLREKTMGLIDADKFLQNMADLYRQAGWNEREVHFSLVDLQMNIFMEDTIPIPRGEPVPVRHGKWIDGHCSLCGCDVPAYIEDWKWEKDMNAKYCPMCGARMDEE